ncbi:MAG: hypothetical protein LBI84_00880 [Propionibacteriaceae bacterium]|jgi:hypothetical protein|nr:hypothetical protein [Propionibacteriaceae bacterium]
MAGPLALVREAFAPDNKVHSVGDIAGRTGLRPDVVEAALEHLLFTGELQARALSSSCPAGRCGSCALSERSCPAKERGRGRSLTLRRTADRAD